VPFPVVRAAYIDNEMKKLKGESSQDESEKKSKFKAAEDAFYQLPEHLQASERVITAPKRWVILNANIVALHAGRQ